MSTFPNFSNLVLNSSSEISPLAFIGVGTPPPAKPAGKKFEGGSSAQEVAKLLRDEANVI